MQNTTIIRFIGGEKRLTELYHKAVTERNETLQDEEIITVTYMDEYVPIKEQIENVLHDILFVQQDLIQGTGMDFIEEVLEENAEARVLLFVAPHQAKLVTKIHLLAEQYPLAVLGAVIQPIQPARIWDYLDRLKVTVPSYEWDWEEGDLDEL